MKQEFNIIFLDIDGVLNSERWAKEQFEKTGKPLSSIYMVDEVAVEHLMNLLRKHDDLKLVISSSWRGLSLSDTRSNLAESKLDVLLPWVIGSTPRCRGNRGQQIEIFRNFADKLDDPFCNNHCEFPFIIKNYVIVDDDRDFLDSQLSHFVHTTWQFGLLDEHITKIEKILYK